MYFLDQSSARTKGLIHYTIPTIPTIPISTLHCPQFTLCPFLWLEESAHVHTQTHNLSPVVSPCVFPSGGPQRGGWLPSCPWPSETACTTQPLSCLPAPPLRCRHPAAVNNCCSLLSERFFYFRSVGLNVEQSIFPVPRKKVICRFIRKC